MNKQNSKILVIFLCLAITVLALLFCSDNSKKPITEQSSSTISTSVDNLSTTEQAQPTTNASNDLPFELSDIPRYSGSPFCEVNNNKPFFQSDELTTDSFRHFSELDSLGRCGVAFACIGTDSLPTEKRGAIGMVKPSGWHTVRYDDLISDKYLYNRCHLIAYELSGENANEKNLITGTRYMNIEGMLPFENKVHDYVENTGNHVLYRSTPIFEGNNLIANGVLLEGLSVEDNGNDISFCVYCYNVQPGIDIDYATGNSKASENNTSNESPNNQQSEEKQNTDKSNIASTTYILNTNTKKFHMPTCSSVSDIKDKNKQEFAGSREEVINMGYSPCGKCHP